MFEKIKKQTRQWLTLKRNILPFYKVMIRENEQGTYQGQEELSKGKDANLEQRKRQILGKIEWSGRGNDGYFGEHFFYADVKFTIFLFENKIIR
jgi:hypothetical protein